MAKTSQPKSDLLDRILKSSTIKSATILSDSKLFNDRDSATTDVLAMNIALSGNFDGGLSSGVTIFAGPSKHFKTNMGLVLIAAYMKQNKDAVCLYYDSEFGSTPSYVAAAGIDTDRVVHSPIAHVEQLKFDIARQLENIHRGDKVIFFVDSIGMLASKKELEDALDEKSVADMTRAKAIRSMFRIITNQFTIKDVPCVIIAHTYDTMDLFPSKVVSGGQSVTLAANTVFVVGKQQIKDGTDVVGYNFVLNVDKSRFIKEKSKIPITVTYSGGIEKYSGLLDIAIDGQFVVSPKQGWYQRVITDKKTGEILPDRNWRRADTNAAEFWDDVFDKTEFKKYVKDLYSLPSGDKNPERSDIQILNEEGM